MTLVVIAPSVQRMGRRNHKSRKLTVGRTRNGTTGSDRQYHAATGRRLNQIPWAASGMPDVQAALVDAFRGLAEEWAAYIRPVGVRMLHAMARSRSVPRGRLALTEDECADLAEDYIESVDLYKLLRGLLGRADTSAEVLRGSRRSGCPSRSPARRGLQTAVRASAYCPNWAARGSSSSRSL